jgi:DNA-binding NarL/FixJ family response regulator
MLVDDHPMWLRTIRAVVQDGGVGKVVAQATDGAEAVALAAQAKPELIVMDVAMPGLGGIDATKRLREVLPNLKVLILSASDASSDILAALEAGADGYLLKTVQPKEVLDAIVRIHGGEAVFPAVVADVVLSHLRAGEAGDGRTPEPRVSKLDVLTDREREVLALMAEGRGNQAIAERLTLTLKTVETHVRSIFAKLQLEPTSDDHRRVVAVLTYLRSL